MSEIGLGIGKRGRLDDLWVRDRPTDITREKKQSDEANQLDRRKISQESRGELRAAIQGIDDPDAQEALSQMFEILTGEDIGEPGRPPGR